MIPAFAISRFKVTNGQYLKFVNEGGVPPELWKRQGRTMDLSDHVSGCAFAPLLAGLCDTSTGPGLCRVEGSHTYRQKISFTVRRLGP